ncbi:MAG: UbiA family prenyltransferase, partial [Bacteroidales bacterium]|nr:UbiA family prenyltransferase [Bacteroidales bacterium]
MQLLPWIRAFRLRTLPLALSCVVMGTFMAVNEGSFNVLTCSLLTITIVLLQVLSNLANDLGDFEHGLDDEERKGPQRALQSGAITKRQMK